jgi:hypothetical protein
MNPAAFIKSTDISACFYLASGFNPLPAVRWYLPSDLQPTFFNGRSQQSDLQNYT